MFAQDALDGALTQAEVGHQFFKVQPRFMLGYDPVGGLRVDRLKARTGDVFRGHISFPF